MKKSASSPEPNPPSFAAVLDELRRNLEINEGQFRHISWKRMAPNVAARHRAHLTRAIELVEWLRRNERLIKHRLAS
jgi:hypothetical protein